MLCHTNMIIPALATLVAGFFASKKSSVSIPLISNPNPVAQTITSNIQHSGGGYSSMDYGSIAQAHRDNRRGKIIKRYR
jgi:hypothetical protein